VKCVIVLAAPRVIPSLDSASVKPDTPVTDVIKVCTPPLVVHVFLPQPAGVLFLRATAGTAIARLSHRNSVRLSVCLSVRPSVTRVDQAKTVQARIIKSSPSDAPKTLVSGSVTIFQKLHRGHPNRGP